MKSRKLGLLIAGIASLFLVAPISAMLIRSKPQVIKPSGRSYASSTISYSIKNPKLIASLEAARKAGPKPSNPLKETARVHEVGDWLIKPVERYQPDADTRIAREEITRLHNQGYNRPSSHTPSPDPIPAMAGLAVKAVGRYAEYKVCKTIDDILSDEE